MEISFNNMGVSREALGQVPSSVEGQKIEDRGPATTRPATTNLTTSRPSTLDAIRDSEPVSEVPDSALSRDDELGNLVNAAFSLPAPPMPNFGN